MEVVEILLISLGVAMDAFTVSICKGLSMKKMSFKKAVIIGLWFGIFQGLMAVIGYFLGSSFESIITKIDHFIAFILLLLIGGQMIKEALTKAGESIKDDVSFKSMFMVSIATSIDALAIGIAYVCAYGSKNAVQTFTTITIVTFLLSVIGVKIGNKFGTKFEKKAQIAGGIILIFLGIKILLEHLNII